VYSGGCDSRCLDYSAFAGRRYTRLAFGLGIVGRYLKELLGIMEELTGWPYLSKGDCMDRSHSRLYDR
jgi:hypothetical protein